ncbi:MAG: hypothetical protein HWE13_05565 [Gammaproteobacteria bacterium]|nr:hypothetical protein [Gammaproteobacteria bacterium]
MASWIEKPCVELLKKLNDVPLDDQRESRQLTLLMAGLADINKEMMRRAAVSVRSQLEPEAPASPAATSPVQASSETKQAMNDVPDLDDFDSFDEELDMIEQTLIRSIND